MVVVALRGPRVRHHQTSSQHSSDVILCKRPPGAASGRSIKFDEPPPQPTTTTTTTTTTSRSAQPSAYSPHCCGPEGLVEAERRRRVLGCEPGRVDLPGSSFELDRTTTHTLQPTTTSHLVRLLYSPSIVHRIAPPNPRVRPPAVVRQHSRTCIYGGKGISLPNLLNLELY
jgi:hypothetical protein